MSQKSLEDLIGRIVQFRDDREWRRFHTPKNVAMALSIEASELLEVFLWDDESEIRRKLEAEDFKRVVGREIGDIMIYALLLCYEIGLSPSNVILGKIEENEYKYPKEMSRGRSTKYTDLKTDDGT